MLLLCLAPTCQRWRDAASDTPLLRAELGAGDAPLRVEPRTTSNHSRAVACCVNGYRANLSSFLLARLRRCLLTPHVWSVVFLCVISMCDLETYYVYFH